MTLYYFFVFIFGLLLGSFLNVVIYRLPKMMEQEWIQEMHLFLAEKPHSINLAPTFAQDTAFNLCWPRSFCQHCKHTLTWWQNIPLISYLILKAKCFYCHARISPRYFLIEVLTAIILLSCIYQFGLTWQGFWAMFFSLILIILTFIDIDHQILPDSLTLPLMWLGLILSLFGLFIPSNTAIIGACLGYLSLWSIYWLFKLITKKEGMGYGDFKLSAALGAWLGWQAFPSILFISALLGTIVGLGLRAFKRLDRDQPIPFGPFLAFSGWVNLMWGDQIKLIYFNLF